MQSAWMLALSLLVLAGSLDARAGDVPEPDGLWRGPMHGETPATVKGATVIDVAALARLRETAKPVMIDVANVEVRPPAMARDMPWTPVHRTIPGATWMPGAGNGTSDADFVKAFEARITQATGGDKSRPVITFCHPQRRGSYNTARRIVSLGYKNVYWFPKGTEGWADGHATADVKADAVWQAAIPRSAAANSQTLREPAH